MNSYFNKILYNGTYITDISQFYTIKHGENDKYDSIYIQHTISNWRSIENVAYDFYGSCDDAWAIIIANNIVNPFNDWLKSDEELRRYIFKNYSNPAGIHHYEHNGIIYNYPAANSKPISNFDYETAENEKKRHILVIKPDVLASIKKDAKLFYEISEQN